MLKVKNLTVNLNNKDIIKDFNYEFKLGEIHCILGHSGSGKTTLLRTIAGLQVPTNGSAILNGNYISKPSDMIFMMHQHYSNFNWLNCLDNVLLAQAIKSKITNDDIVNAKNILSQVGLGEYLNKLPTELSGGMNQRLALARTIIARPPIILMDEPLSALDNETRTNMQNIILNLQRKTKCTIIMVTHSEEEAKLMSNNLLRL